MIRRFVLVFFGLSICFLANAQYDDSEYFDTPDYPPNGLKVNIGPYFTHGELFLSYERSVGDNFSLDLGVSILSDKYRASFDTDAYGGKGFGYFASGKYYFSDYAFAGWYSGFGYQFKNYTTGADYINPNVDFRIFGFTVGGGYRFLLQQKVGIIVGVNLNYFLVKAKGDPDFEEGSEIGIGGRPTLGLSYHF